MLAKNMIKRKMIGDTEKLSFLSAMVETIFFMKLYKQLFVEEFFSKISAIMKNGRNFDLAVPDDDSSKPFTLPLNNIEIAVV